MRESVFLIPLAAGGLIALIALAALLLSADPARADGEAATRQRGGATCACPGASDRPQRPKFADLKAAPDDGQPLDAGDEVAALSSIQHALSSVADGATYVWHRHNGRLSGLVKPTGSFRSAAGDICRHVIVMMTTGQKSRKTEGVACRQPNGVWSLEG